MSKQVIHSDKAPAAIGPYSQAVRTGNLVFLSGQIPLNPETMEIEHDFPAQVERVFTNLLAVCQAARWRLQQHRQNSTSSSLTWSASPK